MSAMSPEEAKRRERARKVGYWQANREHINEVDRARYHADKWKLAHPPGDALVTEKIRSKALRRGYYD